MKTDDLISLLARQAPPIDRHLPTKRFTLALLIAFASASVLMLSLLGLRPDIGSAIASTRFWIKAALPALLGIGALWMVIRLARPGIAPGPSGWVVLTPLLAVWIASAAALLGAPPADRLALLLGQTWRVCPVLIALLSLPGLIALFWALRGLAPTRLRLAGAAAGLLAGATATLVYCFHCPEMGVPFWGCWYVLGMAVPTLIGALLGRRWLAW
ncbi:DUF1109 domain-containing protein [Robbsia sp. KACC 23696]|uniref:DUF1109 domain-containing protein n=1 Tax=Robbsia sp. KACC 23696 TaxID=3149231 RepID=UPI00325BE6F0